MKEQLELKDFLKYRFISNIQFTPDGKKAAYVLSNCDWDHNGYQHFLYLYDGKTSSSTDGGLRKRKPLFWQDDQTLLFSNVRR